MMKVTYKERRTKSLALTDAQKPKNVFQEEIREIENRFRELS
jgi:hypothetical protein